jgi:acetyltransferase-like isoleucine patch superfamily enzyme
MTISEINYKVKKKLKNIVRYYFFQYPRVLKYKLLSDPSVRIKGSVKQLQPILFVGQGDVIFGNNIDIGYFPSPYYFNSYSHIDLRGDGASVIIGDNVKINNNLSIISSNSSITIQKNCLIGLNVTIMTSDFHNTNPKKRRCENCEDFPVLIEENVFIGNNVTILKGTIVGKNSVVANGTIVSKNVPANVITAGIPNKTIKVL